MPGAPGLAFETWATATNRQFPIPEYGFPLRSFMWRLRSTLGRASATLVLSKPLSSISFRHPFSTKCATVYPNDMICSMATSATNPRQQAHELIDRMAPSQVFAVVGLLQTMLDPVSRAIANAPFDDEPETESERQAVAASKAWMAEHPGQGIPHDEILAEFGLASQDVR